MRKCKYLMREFDNGWVCVHMGIAYVEGKKAKAPGAVNHYYILERQTSDNKAEKIIRLNSNEMARVNRGEILVEDIVKKRAAKKSVRATRKVNYHFSR